MPEVKSNRAWRLECEALREAMREALRALPRDSDMIEHNPDEGMRLFCCAGRIVNEFRASDRIEHATDCWYCAARNALAVLGDAPRSRDALALDDVQTLLDAQEWTADTLAAVANIVRQSGRRVRDLQ